MSRLHFSWRGFITVISALYMLYIVIYVLDLVPMLFGIGIMGYVHKGIFLGLILFFAFIITPARKSNKSPQWYDILLAVLSLIPTLYYSIFFEISLFELEYSTPINVILGGLLILLVGEAARRMLGWIFAGLMALSLLYLVFGNHFPGILQADSYALDKIAGFMYVSREGIMGIPVNIASKIIISFMLFSQLLFISGAGDWFVNIANSIIGYVRGGPAKASIIASGGFGMITPSPPANVASTGVVTIPLIIRTGFSRTFAAGVESVASTGGQIMPPVMGSTIFILCEYIGLPYAQLIIYAFLPAILYYLALFLQVDLNAGRNNIRGIPRAELPRFIPTLKQGWSFLIPIVILIICMMVLDLSPEKSAIVSSISIVIITWFRKKNKIGFKELVDSSDQAMRSLVPIALACAAVGVIIGSITLSLLSFRITFQLVEWIGQNMIIILIMAAVVSYIMGMGVGPLASYLTLAMMVAPAIIQMGVPKLAIHLFLFYWSVTTFITPPYAIATMVAAGIAKCGLWRAGFQAMRLGIAVYMVPFFFVYNPAILLIGSPVDIAIAVVAAVIGISAIAAGVEGFIVGKVNWILRILLLGGGFYLAISSGFGQLFAIAAIAVALAWHLIVGRLKHSAPIM